MVWLRLECGPAGVSIKDVAAGMVNAAEQLYLPVVCQFNGVDLHADPETTTKDVLAEYRDALRFRSEIEAETARDPGPL